MRLSHRILLYFSVSFVCFIGVSLWVIYTVFEEYRRDEFLQRLEDEGQMAITQYARRDSSDGNFHLGQDVLSENFMDDAEDEKLIIFDEHKNVIYNSAQSGKINYPKDILNQLGKDRPETEQNEKGVSLKGLYLTRDGHQYYIIAKASDTIGLRKREYLKDVLLLTFLAALVIIVSLSFYLSRQISAPLKQITQDISNIDIDTLHQSLRVPREGGEIRLLARKFNEVLGRLEQSVRFQTHFIHHVSHELKTPIAVLVSNLEQAEQSNSIREMRNALAAQKGGLLDLAGVIDALLDISRSESGQPFPLNEQVRIDDMIFQITDDLQQVFPRLHFEIILDKNITDERQLIVHSNRNLLKTAFQNLLKNAWLYHDRKTPVVAIAPVAGGLCVSVTNDGPTLPAEERALLFRHFFRGANSRGHKGFGIGLVLVQRVTGLHGGTVRYDITAEGSNQFALTLPLA
ncbi:MAG: HAMP domain-containing sensor histidine kinase [Saprospiraceae bacterium]